jgi:hypothetical protein
MATRILGPTGSKRRHRFLYVPFLVAALVVLGALVSGGSVLAAPSTDASVSEYSQCANGSPPGTTTACPQNWINGILNPNNSGYHEDQNTAQRLFLDLPRNGPTTSRKIILKYLARKGQGGVGNHAYDSLGQWNYTQTTADRCQGVTAANCPGGAESTKTIPVDNTVVADSNGAGSSTAGHELPDANRYMSMFGGVIDSVTAPVHDNPSGSGDDYASVTVTYHVTSTPAKVELLFGGHLAASAGTRGWGGPANVGAAFINGGPYHIKLTQVDNSSVGNRDNQIMSGAILPIGTVTQTALHQTDSSGVDVSPANNQDPVTQTGITVTLPANGNGVYVTDYATVAPTGSTGTVAFRFYSSQATCTADTAFTGGSSAGSGKTLNASSVAKSDTVHITTAGVTYWRAHFTGTGLSTDSDSGCSDEILTANQATTTGTTLHETNSSGVDVSPANNGDPISINAGGYVTDYANVTPSSISSGTVTFRYYSTSALCTADTTGSGGTSGGSGGVSSGAAHGSAIQFNTSGTFYWKAFYSGATNINASSSSCEVLNVRQPTSTSTTLHETNSSGVDVSPNNNGDPISIDAGSYVTDYASVTPSTATGSVVFRYYSTSALCTADTDGTGGASGGSGTISSGSAHGSAVQFSTSGTFYWRAFFTGTGLNNNSSSSCEVLNVRQPTSTSTTLHETNSIGVDVFPANNGGSITVLPGAYVTDYASVTPSTATGSVAFEYYSSLDDCTNDANGTTAGGGSLSSGSATSDSVLFSTVGTFYWKAFFTGTGLNNDSQSPCNEILTVQKANPTIASDPRLIPQDHASIAGIIAGGTTQATITFSLFGPADATCSGPALYSETQDVNGTGTQTFTTANSGDPLSTPAGFRLTSASASGTYHWSIDYSGDEANNANNRDCVESFDFEGITDAAAG